VNSRQLIGSGRMMLLFAVIVLTLPVTYGGEVDTSVMMISAFPFLVIPGVILLVVGWMMKKSEAERPMEDEDRVDMSEGGEVKESRALFWWHTLTGSVGIFVFLWCVVSGIAIFEQASRLGIDNAWMYFVLLVGVGAFFLFDGGYRIMKADKYRRPVARMEWPRH